MTKKKLNNLAIRKVVKDFSYEIQSEFWTLVPDKN